ncbi:MAG: hypothetical protein VX149_09505, partial [Pseudomonadota bacterium]|nr:hypothetical protein [Pseudomonadota bacterium]
STESAHIQLGGDQVAALKMGARLKSTVCSGEIMVVMAPDTEVEMTCGGAAMVDAGESVTPSGEVHPDHAVGVVMGKRYIDEAETLEVLCVKAGDGSLAANGTLLLQKDTKKLPKTD